MKIFINYRREDARYVAGRIFDILSAEFGHEEVFMDVTHIPVGSSFPDHIRNVIRKSEVFLIIIGEDWLTRYENVPPVSLSYTNDFMFMEIHEATKTDCQIIPIFVDDVTEIPGHLLPIELSSLANLNGLSVRPDPDFHTDTERLIKQIKLIAPERPSFLPGSFTPPDVQRNPTTKEGWKKYRRQIFLYFCLSTLIVGLLWTFVFKLEFTTIAIAPFILGPFLFNYFHNGIVRKKLGYPNQRFLVMVLSLILAFPLQFVLMALVALIAMFFI